MKGFLDRIDKGSNDEHKKKANTLLEAVFDKHKSEVEQMIITNYKDMVNELDFKTQKMMDVSITENKPKSSGSALSILLFVHL